VRLVYDFETNGLFLDDLRPGTKNASAITKVHCLVTQDVDTGEVAVYHDAPEVGLRNERLFVGVQRLLQADVRYAHNGLTYDERVIRTFFPDQWAARRLDAKFLDSMVGAACVWPTEHLRRLDAARIARARLAHLPPFPPELVGRQSLESWGRRLGNRKAGYDGGWEKFNPAMLAYCVQDVSTLRTLVQKLDAKIAAKHFTVRAWELEQDFKLEIAKQMANGFAFDVPAAEKLAAELQIKRAAIVTSLGAAVEPFENHYLTEVKKIPKVKRVPFNPGSRHHIARYLEERHGWKPDPREGYTPTGAVKIDETVLEGLKGIEHVPEFIEYLTVTKVLGMLAEGATKKSVPWIKMVGPDGRIHGNVDHNGAVTSRCTHNRPNMTQVPKVGNPYGAECRALFIPSPGNVLVGVDASGLELRMLAHYLHKYDDGEYGRIVTDGDVHEKNRVALEIPQGETGPEKKKARDTSKRGIYAELYGAGEEKLGKTLDPALGMSVKWKARGRRAKQSLLANVKGLRALKERCAALHEKVHSVNLPDGRRAWTRSDYAALNTLLQASGAIVMKLAVVLLHRQLRELGIVFRQVHQAHDEIQGECLPEHAATVQMLGCAAIAQAGVELGIRCPLKGEAKTGRNWAETH